MRKVLKGARADLDKNSNVLLAYSQPVVFARVALSGPDGSHTEIGEGPKGRFHYRHRIMRIG